MKSLLFWSLLAVVVVILVYASHFSVDGFTIQYPTPELVIPKVNPPRETLTAGDFKAYAPPSFTLLAPPPGGAASVNTLPYRDPALEKAPYARIRNLFETANGFTLNEAPKLSSESDPAVQLPLTTLRADIRRLGDEMQVLSRNPGIDSSLTQSDVDGIQANLAYLQKWWRQSVNSRSGMIEGFASTGNPATLSQLNDLLTKIAAEITRLGASSTTDPFTKSRIETLKTIQTAVQGIVDKVNKKQMEAKDIPIMEADYQDFLPALANSNSRIGDLLTKSNLSPSIASLFPSYEIGDLSGAALTRYLFNTYSDTFFKGLSWDMRLNYVGERTKDIAEAKSSYAQSTAAAAASLAAAAQWNKGYGSAGGDASVPSTEGSATGSSSYRGEFASQTNGDNSSDSGAGTQTTMVQTGKLNTGSLDWKKRSADICSAIRKRGYEPGDFGCLESTQNVGDDFSWRGYARMVCTRLGTLYDTSAPEACGCPPPTWPGWRL